MNTVIPDEISDIMKKVEESGAEIFIVGGYVRDMIIGVPSKDVDLFTNATGEEIKVLFPDSKVIGGEERQNKILTTIVGENIELSSYRSNGNRTETGISLEYHLKTCDLSINAIAMDINGNITDPHLGSDHITDKVIRCVGNPHDRIEEDKLRVFRTIRFSLRFGFTVDKNLSDIIRETNISDIPVERIREEILKILMYPDGLKGLQDSGLFTKVIPEFWYNIGLNGGHHHNETVDNHMHNAQNIARELTDNSNLILAISLHDIGKGLSYQIKEDGDISFHGHEHVGADIIRDVMDRMKFSNDDVKYVVALVDNHLLNYDDETTDKAYIRRFKKLEDAGVSIEDYMIMLYADHQGNLKNERVKFGDFISLNKFNEKYYSLKFSNVPFGINDLDITGFDLMAAGVPAGPEVGKVLAHLFEMVINGEVGNTFRELVWVVNMSE